MKVFLSHSAAAAHANQFTVQLAAAGIHPVDAASLVEPGCDWASAVEKEVQSADALVFLVEPGAERDPRLQAEWRSAIQDSWSGPAKPMIPVLVEDAKLPGFLKDRPAITVAREDDWAEVAKQVADSLRTAENPANPGAGLVDAAQAAQRTERLGEIAEDAAKLAPTHEELARQAGLLRERIRAAGEDSQSVAVAKLHVDLADVLKRLDKESDALPELETAADILALHPDAEDRLARVRSNLATLLRRLGRKDEARRQLEGARDLYIRLEGPQSLAALATRASLVTLLRELGDDAAADREKEALTAGLKSNASALIKRIPLLDRLLTRFLRGEDRTK